MWVCPCVWPGEGVRFFRSPSPGSVLQESGTVLFLGRCFSWDAAFPGTRARMAALWNRSMGVCICT